MLDIISIAAANQTFLQAAAESAATYPKATIGGIAAIAMAVLKLLHKQWPNSIPDIVGWLFGMIPGFMGKDTLQSLLVKVFEKLVEEGMSEDDAASEVESLMKSSGPKLALGQQAKFCKSLKAKRAKKLAKDPSAEA